MVDKYSAVCSAGPLARPLRILYPGAVYHVMNRGMARQPVFRTAADRQAFLTGVAEAHALWGIEVYASCLMDPHYPLVLQTPEASLPRVLRAPQRPLHATLPPGAAPPRPAVPGPVPGPLPRRRGLPRGGGALCPPEPGRGQTQQGPGGLPLEQPAGLPAAPPPAGVAPGGAALARPGWGAGLPRLRSARH